MTAKRPAANSAEFRFSFSEFLPLFTQFVFSLANQPAADFLLTFVAVTSLSFHRRLSVVSLSHPLRASTVCGTPV
jgi:hypothetical protein